MPEGNSGVDPVQSLADLIGREGRGLREFELRVHFAGEGKLAHPDRNDIHLEVAGREVIWRVETLRELFRGDKHPPSESGMEHYPEEYVPFFAVVEYNLVSACEYFHDPTDAAILDVYTLMRRRPDAKSVGAAHHVVWQAAALALGVAPFSEAEYQAVFSQLARSARHWEMGPSSRNYIDYLRTSFAE
ncbi:MAG: hypothetical protein WCP22_10780 [Chlamydiota bacterium]